MRDLYSDYLHEVEVGGRRVKVWPSFDVVIQLIDLQRNKAITIEDYVFTAAELLTGKRNPLRVTAAIVTDTMEKLGSSEKRVQDAFFSFTQDAFLIYAAFRQAYGIDLHAERGKMHFTEFVALFSALPEDTRLSKVMSVRAQPIPAMNKNNAKQVQQLIRMKTLWRLKPEEGDEEESMQNGPQKIFRTLQSMAKGGG